MPVRTLLLCIPVLLVACSAEEASPALSPTAFPYPKANRDLVKGKVLRVIDGATVEVESDGQIYRVRYLGIQIPDDGLAEDSGQSVSQGALHFNRFLVEGKSVELAADAIDSDLNGNLLRYVFVGGEMVNKMLLETGHASVAYFPSSFRHQGEFVDAEEDARNDERGIWTRSQPHIQQQAITQTAPPDKSQFGGGTLPSIQLFGSVNKCDFSNTSLPAIKGNVEARNGKRLYHVPGGLFYSTTVIDEAKGDRWFCTEEEAEATGWHRSKR